MILKTNLIRTNSVKATPTKVAVKPPISSVRRKLLFGSGIESIISLMRNITIIILKLIGIFNNLITKKYIKNINAWSNNPYVK